MNRAGTISAALFVLAAMAWCGTPCPAPAAEWPTPINASTLAGVTPGTGGLAVLDDASPSAIRTTLSLGDVALLSRVARGYDFFNAPATVWTNIPAATTEIFGVQTRRIKADLTGVSSIRVSAVVTVTGAANSTCGPQFSLNDGTTWFFMDGSADGDLAAIEPQVSIFGTGSMVSAYASVHASAQMLVTLRLVCDDGDGAADPQFTVLAIEVK